MGFPPAQPKGTAFTRFVFNYYPSSSLWTMPLVIGVYIGSGFMALARILRSSTIDWACHRQGAMTMTGYMEMGLRKGMAGRVLGPPSHKASGRCLKRHGL